MSGMKASDQCFRVPTASRVFQKRTELAILPTLNSLIFAVSSLFATYDVISKYEIRYIKKVDVIELHFKVANFIGPVPS